MATYKVIQDIEAEDKLVGPFSFRQFIYILIAAFLGYLSFVSAAKGAAFLLVIFVPPMLFCMFFAWPWTPDQPTEVWALARIRFYFKARKRIWDQAGIKDFVTITVPKKIERIYTDGLTQTEVRSRLSALASTIDSRGWAIKNANLEDARPVDNSDRLLGFAAMPQPVSDVSIRADEDILDEANNPLAQHMATMVDAATRARRQEMMERMADTTPAAAPAPQPQWFSQPTQAAAQPAMTAAAEPVSMPTPLPSTTDHLKNIDPARPAAPVQPQPTASQPNAAILNLAHDNNLDVATLAREAKRVHELDSPDGEVVVSLR